MIEPQTVVRAPVRRLTPRTLFRLRVVLPLLSTLVTLVAIEGGLALLHPIPFSIETNMYFVADPYTGFRLQPNSVGSFQKAIAARTNRYGHRNPDVSLEKPAGVYRLLVLGDSFTIGANVREEDAWPRVLERQLRLKVKRPVEVINTAVGGWEPFQYAQDFAHNSQRFAPDLILVGFFVGNDTYASTRIEDTQTAIAGRRMTRAAAQRTTVTTQVWLYEHFHLARLVLNRGPVLENVSRTDCRDFTDQYLSIQTARLPNHLCESPDLDDRSRPNVDQIARISQLANIPVIVVLIPDENQINPALQDRIVRDRSLYDWTMPQAMLAPMFRRAGLQVIDLLTAFRDDPRCLYMNDTHWTPEGHELAASIVLPQVLTFFD